MTPRDLPAELVSARARLLEGVSRATLKQQAADLSRRYRRTAGSHARASEVLAYAVTRMPATYAACVAVLDEVRACAPDFTPRTLLDLGSGPGTAGWAGCSVFDSLDAVTALEREPGFRNLAARLAHDHPVLSRAVCLPADLEAPAAIGGRFDLVTGAFVLAEIAPTKLAGVVATAWAAAVRAMVLIEPGTPEGAARILAARAALVAAGARVLAPCPHDHACPLSAGDWCHFAVRLPRGRDHRQVKAVDAPFEDEKFAYVVCVRDPATPAAARVLRPPRSSKVEIAAVLCTKDGIVEARVAARDRPAHRAARGWRWGDAVTGR